MKAHLPTMFNLSYVIALSTLVGGCAMPYRPYQLGMGSSGSANGIKTALATHNEVDVFLVHGMCTHGREWVARANNRLQKSLGVPETHTSKNIAPPILVSEKESELYRIKIELPSGQSLVTYSIVWSPATVPEKTALCYDRDDARNNVDSEYCTGEPRNYYQRAELNGTLKNSLLDDCLSDAMVYVGPKKERIQLQMRELIERGAGDRAPSGAREDIRTQAAVEKAPLFVVTESLGSKIFFDSLLLMICDGPGAAEVARATVQRTAQIFMAANQVPMISLAAPLSSVLQSPRCQTADAATLTRQISRGTPGNEDSLGELFKLFGTGSMRLKDSIDRVEVVAFSDPNDLLSWPLKNSKQQKGASYSTADIIVSNARTWFGVVEHPLHAHTDYLENPDVRKIIACGLPISNTC